MNPSERKGNGNGKAPSKGGGAKKVAVLRTAISSGKYRVESGKIADKMVKDAVRELRVKLR